MKRRYFHDEVGWNSRLDSIQAAVLQVKLTYLPPWNQQRRTLAARYDELLSAAKLTASSTKEGIVLPIIDPRAKTRLPPVRHPCPSPRRPSAISMDRQTASEIYRYPLPLHLQTSLAHLGYKKGDFPHSEQAAEEVLALPIYLEP